MTRQRTTEGIWWTPLTALIAFLILGYLLAVSASSTPTKPEPGTVYEDGSVEGYGCLVGWPCDDRSNR